MGSYSGSARDSLISVISPRASLRLSEKIWVGGTITLISFLVYVPQVFIIWPWYGRELSASLLKLLIPFNLLAVMMFRCYYLCVNTSPGSVPAGWTPPTDPDTPLELKSKTSQHRFCKTCRIHKPPRTHHCRRCGKCVLKMDHHCPWVANCVGFYNQGHFIRFLIYVDLATTYHLCMMGMRMKSLTAWTSPEPSTTELILVIVNFALCVPVWLMVGVFSIYHMYCAAGNSTTIEGWEKDRVATMVRRGKIREVKYPYNLGFYANICSVLGRNPLLWLWPQKMKGDGLSYPVSQVIGAFDQFTWPPQDPSRYPARALPYSSGSAFTYGNGSFNPNLQPSSSRLRARTSSYNQDEGEEGGNSTGPLPASLSGRPPAEDYSSGEERDREDKHWTTDSDEDRSRENSSPEPYLSDFDDDFEDNGTGDRDAERGMARTRRVRVRRGSEGYEIAPRRDWGAELDNDDMHMGGDGYEMTRMGDDNDHDDDNAERKKL